MTNNELVSIIMPAYNAEKYIEEAIQRVIEQTYEKWELIVVDDASTDSTAAIAQAFADQDKRIRLIRLSANGGVANARNVAMENAKGRFLAFLDSDDLWLSEKLERQLSFMREKNCAFSFHSYRHFSEKEVSNKLVSIPEVLCYEDALCGNHIGCLTVCLDRTKLKPFIMPKARHEDYITWLNILKDNSICAYGLKEDLARYRIGNGGTVSSNKVKSAWWTWLVIRGQGLNIYRSIWFMYYYIKNGVAKWL